MRMLLCCALALAACGSARLCDFSTCAGCCDTADGRCHDGNDDTWCGSGGRECSSCGLGMTCGTTRHCIAECDSTNCNGCCTADTGTCFTGATDAFCGTGGVTCESCAAGKHCDPTFKVCRN